MKKRTAFLFFAIVCCILLGACAPRALPTGEKQCRVVLSDSPHYSCSENIRTVARGEDAEFTILLENGYGFSAASYGDYAADVLSVDDRGRTAVALKLKNVRYPVFVDVELVEVAKTYRVELAASEFFRCESGVQSVREGESAVFTLMFKAEYTLDSVKIDGSENSLYHVTGLDGDPDADNERRVVLSVENVRADAAVTVKEKRFIPGDVSGIVLQPIAGQAVVGYALNGGSYISESGGSYFTVNYPLEHFNRPNTAIGTDTIRRDGYTLIGWNTERDGGGKHIGLGSRADVRRGETLWLYAEWAKESDPELFDYVVIDEDGVTDLYMERGDKRAKLDELAKAPRSENRCAVVTAYRGTDEMLVIPETLGGYPVAATAPHTLVGNSRVQTAVFPPSVRYIMETSFIACENLTEIYIFDNLRNVDYNAFGSNYIIRTLHINAITPPIYGLNESAQLANKIDMLVDHGEGPKTVLFGSCSIWYSISARMLGEATGRTVYNMGVEGDTCVLSQLDLIMQYMNEGDELVYLCDMGSPYLLGYDVSFDPRSFRMFEADYDLLATLDLQRYSAVFSALNEYLMTKKLSLSYGETGSYDDYLPYISEFGDMETERVGNDNDGVYLIPKAATLLEKGAFEKTEVILGAFADLGVDVYYGFGLISEECLYASSTGVSDIMELNALFEERFASGEMSAKMVGKLSYSVLPAKYFYNTTYRLTTEGTEYYTKKFIEYFEEATER